MLADDLDIVEKLSDLSKIRMETYQQRIAKSYNKNIKIRKLQVEDLVLRKVLQNLAKLSAGNLAPKWEGRFLKDSEARKGNIGYSPQMAKYYQDP